MPETAVNAEPLPEKIGPYRIQAKLGQGGMGAVYRAVHETLERPAAVKLLPPELAQNPDYVRRFLREARLAATLRHDNVVQVYDAGAAEGRYFIAMELVEGQSLADYLEQRSALDEAEAVELMHQAARGLAAAHARGLVHRDIKPENLLLDKTNTVRIVDFGLVMEQSGQTQLTAAGACLGTPLYMSPEQADGEKADARTDLYSLGVTFYRALTGQTPFVSESVMSLLFKHKFEAPKPPRLMRPELSENISNLVLILMAKRREDRPASASALLKMIEEMREGKPVLLPPPAPSPATVQPSAAFAPTLVGQSVAAVGATRTPFPAPSGAGGVPPAQATQLPPVAAAAAPAAPRRIRWPAPVAVGGVVVLALVALLCRQMSRRAGQTTVAVGAGAASQQKPPEVQPPPDPKAAEREALLKDAKGLESNGQYASALALYEKAAASGPTPELQGRIEELKAKIAPPKVVEKPPPPPDPAAEALAQAERLRAEGRLEDAAQAYERAAGLSGDAARGADCREKANACRREVCLGRAREAEAREDWPAAAAAYSLALTFGKSPELEARRDLMLTREKTEKDFRAYLEAGDKAAAAGQHAQARANYNLALRLKPDDARAKAKLEEANRLEAQAAKAEGAVIALIGDVAQRVREGRTAEAYQRLISGLAANPTEARLTQLKAGLETLQACEGVCRGLQPVLTEAQNAAVQARQLDSNDSEAERLQRHFGEQVSECQRCERQAREQLLSQSYDALRGALAQVKGLASDAASRLEGARTRYADKAKEAAEFKGIDAGIFRVGVRGNKEKAERLNGLSATFGRLAGQALALGR